MAIIRTWVSDNTALDQMANPQEIFETVEPEVINDVPDEIKKIGDIEEIIPYLKIREMDGSIIVHENPSTNTRRYGKRVTINGETYLETVEVRKVISPLPPSSKLSPRSSNVMLFSAS